MYLRLNNQRITTINNIDYIIKNKPPNRINPPIIFEKNVLVCYSNINEAMNLVQHYQKDFFINNNIEDYMPYFIFNELSLLNNNINDIWKVNILIDEEKEVINIHAVNENLQIWQTDYDYEDFHLRLKKSCGNYLLIGLLNNVGIDYKKVALVVLCIILFVIVVFVCFICYIVYKIKNRNTKGKYMRYIEEVNNNNDNNIIKQ